MQQEYHTGIEIVPVPLYAQSGDGRYTNVDKLILKQVDVLTHGPINEVDSNLGPAGDRVRNF